MPLQLENLRNAIASLAEALMHSENVTLMNSLDETLRPVIRAGVIKHFEFTYEQSWLSIKRWLEANVNPNAADGVTRRELFRLGAEQRLIDIDDIDRWMDYHAARNRTSHTYRETTANEVYAVIPAFLTDARLLLTALEARND